MTNPVGSNHADPERVVSRLSILLVDACPPPGGSTNPSATADDLLLPLLMLLPLVRVK
jgi:hypothetical protein